MNILITGSAHGIGAATARQFAQAGHHVGIFDIDAAGAQALATQLGKNAISGVLDVCSESDWDRILRQFTEHFGSLDVLVNNAGLLCSGKFEQIELSRHLDQLQVNVNGVLLGCYKVRPYLSRMPMPKSSISPPRRRFTVSRIWPATPPANALCAV